VARAAGIFGAIVVSSDDQEVLAVARDSGADMALTRDASLSGDAVQVKDVCVSVIANLAASGRTFSVFAVLLPTSPLRTADDIRGAYTTLVDTSADCCMSLVACEHPPQRAVSISAGRVVPYFGQPYLKPTQALEPLYRHDGSVIFVRTEAFLREPTFYGDKVVPYVIPRERAVDVDAPLDLAWAEFLASRAEK
jgi:CMP-N-acetylneuraminic acid synthetase